MQLEIESLDAPDYKNIFRRLSTMKISDLRRIIKTRVPIHVSIHLLIQSINSLHFRLRQLKIQIYFHSKTARILQMKWPHGEIRKRINPV
jgi:hypothetical protein